MLRRVLVAAAILLGVVVATSHVSATTISPCRDVTQPIWSPDGTQIAYYGHRWPPPSGYYRQSWVLQALCTMKADGTNAQPLRYTVCSGKGCPDLPYLVAWLPSGILYYEDGVLYRIVAGSKPQKIARLDVVSVAPNPTGTRVATDTYYDSCLTCAAPVTVRDTQSGAVVGEVGGKKFNNVDPSLSRYGTQVAFERDASDESGKTFGIWTANANGSHLRQLAKVGHYPLWSPMAGKIAYVAPAGKSSALRLIAAGGGKSRALVPRNVETVYGWSPDGRYIAFESGTGSAGALAVIDVATGKVRNLLRLRYGPTAAWAPDSSELVANSVAPNTKCWSTWRVPVDGSKPTLISSCTS
jgi:hypothetical protein